MIKKVISGIQPSNRLTLGNYLGVISNLVNMQNMYEMYIFVADLHAITNNFDQNALYQNKKNIVAMCLAAGLDINKVKIFYQSDVLEHANLGHILLCHTTIGELNRMTQFKDKSQKISAANGTEFIPTGLFTYPTLMAADILLYDVDLVPVGSDQKQHIELTRNIATRMNNKYGNDLFKLPEPVIPQYGSRVMDLQEPTIKMSKSNKNEKGIIYLLDDPQVAYKKIMSAKTDNLNVVKHDIQNQPGITNLINIYAAITNSSIKDIEEKYVNKNYAEFKKDLAQIISSFLKELQVKYYAVIDKYDEIENQLKIHAETCRKIASKKLDYVYKKIGLKN